MKKRRVISKWIKGILLGIVLLNPISLFFYLYLLGLGFDYSGSRDNSEIVTFLSSSNPPLPRRSTSPYGPLSFSSWAYRQFGDIQISDWDRKKMTLYDTDNTKIAEIIPSNSKQNKEYMVTTDNKFIPTGKIFESYGMHFSSGSNWVRFPDLHITLFNRDGTTLTGPYEDNELYAHYAYLNGQWKRYPGAFVMPAEDFKSIEKSKAEADYFISVPAGYNYAQTDAQENISAHTIAIINNKQYKEKPTQFLFEKNVHYWDLPIKHGDNKYLLRFITIKNPSDLIFYPQKGMW